MLLYSEAFALAHLSVQNSAFCKAINKKTIFVVLIIKETFYFYQVGSIKIFLFWQSL